MEIDIELPKEVLVKKVKGKQDIDMSKMRVSDKLFKDINAYKTGSKSANDKELLIVKQMFTIMAESYLSDLSDNLGRSAIELAGKYSDKGTVDDWKDFLNFPPVNGYRTELIEDEVKAKSNFGLLAGEDTKKALDVQSRIESRGGNGKNAHIVVMMMPSKREE